jgi:hypothetical protein
MYLLQLYKNIVVFLFKSNIKTINYSENVLFSHFFEI